MTALLIVLGVGPSLIWMFWLWSRDKFQREPLGLVAKLMFGGGALAVGLTLLAVPLYEVHVPGLQESPMLNMLLLAALPEELFKMLPVLLFAWRSRRWNEPFDGIVYAGATALGFHLLETAKYMVTAADLGESLGQALLRGAKPGHMLYGVAMGYFLSRARFGRPQDRWKHFGLALAVPVALHTAWNTAGVYGGSLVGGRTLGEVLVALIAWGLSVGLWVTAYAYIREGLRSSPWNPVQSVPMAPEHCESCGGGYPHDARFCHSCGAKLALPAGERFGTN